MRIDHFAYQRAARVASLGFLLQAALGLTLLLFGLASGDTAFNVASLYVLTGLLVWVGLVVVFIQHKMERLEALEIDELQAGRMASGSAFDDEEMRVAAKRLGLMHKWLMPALSLLVALLLAGFAWFAWVRVDALVAGEVDARFQVTDARGWAVAISLALAATAFIFSRFVAGMAKQPAWQNLRGGAAYMVGNALVALGLVVGVVFLFFDRPGVLQGVARAIPVFMAIVAAEILLNFVLNLYRPRKPGEVPRPAFDSKLLSLLATPDSIVRSINEAVNYQFGFDITSSWGYQLLLRRFRWLALFAFAVLVALNCMVVVEPHEQAVKLRGGRLVGDVHGAGILWKLPWPFERAEVYDVSRLRELPLTAQLPDDPARRRPNLWSQPLDRGLGFEPFLVTTEPVGLDRREIERLREIQELEDQAETPLDVDPEAESREEDVRRLAGEYALIETEIILEYRIRRTEDGRNGLLDFIQFGDAEVQRRRRLNNRERTLKSLALREVTQFFSRMELDRLVAGDAGDVMRSLRRRIQETFDDHEAGVEVLAVSVPWVRPAGDAARDFERLAFNRETKAQRIAQARSVFFRSMTGIAGRPEVAEAALAQLQELKELRERTVAEETPEEREARLARIEALEDEIAATLLDAGGLAASMIEEARADRRLRPIMEMARARRFLGRLEAYRTAPDLYREYLKMDMLGRLLADARKYFVAVDPEALSVDVEMLGEDEMFLFEDAGVGQSGQEANQ